jgi:hypothetical protein
MVLVLAKHGCGMALVGDEDAVEELASDAADEAFGDGVGRGARTGVWMMRTSMAVNTVSRPAVNLASRSRTPGHPATQVLPVPAA